MVRKQRHVLVVGAGQDALDRVAPMLRRAEFEVHTVDPSPFVLDLVLGTTFELIIATFPLDGLSIEELLAAVRNDGSGCRQAGVLLLSEPETINSAQGWVDRGVNRVVARDWADARMWQAVGDLLNVAPRVALRVLVEVEVGAGSGQGSELCRTENVSASGMLLRGSHDFMPGSRFDFALCLPGSSEVIHGSAEVVRPTDPERDHIEGCGARFVRFRGDGRERLEAYIRRKLEKGRASPPRK